MDATMDGNEKARFDFRLPKSQKELFERAAILGGYRNLTDFFILIAQERAKEIIEENESFLQSQRDKEIFFDAIMSPPQPNDALSAAAEAHKKHLR